MDDFRFGKQVRICGQCYWVDPNVKKDQARRLVMMRQIAQMKKEEDTPEKAEKMLECSKELINLLLGEGAFDRIFEGRNISLTDVTALLNYIAAQLS